MLKLLKRWWSKGRMTPVERYLADSCDLVELEQRQKNLMRKGIWI